MSTLRAGSYLKMLSDPQLDLMDIVNEEAPQFRKKEEHWIREDDVKIGRRHMGSEDWDVIETYRIPVAGISNVIESENTHGLRFSTCHQRSESFTVEPSTRLQGAWARNGSSNSADWDWHQHLSTRIVTGEFAGRYDKSFGLLPWDYSVYNELYPGYPGWPVDLIDIDDDPLCVDEELVRAYDVIRPAVTSDTSLLVTLAEVKDVKSLFTEPMAFANRLIQTIGRKSAKKWTFASILTDPDKIQFIAKTLAKGHLYTEFGLKQTVRDVSALFSTFWSLDNTVRTILSQTGSNTRHYSVPVYEKTVDQNDGCVFQDYNWILCRYWQSTLTRKFVVTMKYTAELVDAFGQPISPNDTKLVRLGSVMDSLGVNLNPAILWDVVPFSFVVDYFVGIGDWLERFKRNNLNFTFGVEDSCYSIKREIATSCLTGRYTSEWDGYQKYPDDPFLAVEESLGALTMNHFMKTYDRVRFAPSARMLTGLDAPDFRLPSIGQLKILASMLTTNLPIIGRKG